MANPLYADAKAEIEALGFVVARTEAQSSSVAEGRVISIDPPVGTLLPEGTIVTLLVSSGPPPSSRWTGTQPEVVQAALESTEHAAIIALLVHLNVPGDPFYGSNAGANIKWDGHTWKGLAQLASVDSISESLELYAQPLKLTLATADSGARTAARESNYKGADAKVYLAVFDPYTYALLDTPEEVFSGFMDVMTIEGDYNEGAIVVECEHDLFRQPATSRWTDEDQRLRFAGDTFFDKLSQISGSVAKWGSRDVGYTGSVAGPGHKGRGHIQEF